MTGHRVYARHDGVEISDKLSIPLIKKCICDTLHFEGVDIPCEVSVLITDDKGIKEINRVFRGSDKTTDVLSFPMQEFYPPGWSAPGIEEIHPETGLLPLGDIILSAERIKKQACEYFQPIEHETAYLITHSVLHLLGYDHIDEAEEKKRMREREEGILDKLGIRG